MNNKDSKKTLIPEEICRKIVFAGTDPDARGGVAAVLSAYREFLSPFQHIITTREGSVFVKLFTLFSALIQLVTWKIRGAELIHIHGASYNSFRRKTLIIKIAHLLHYRIVYHLHGGEFHLYSKNIGYKKIYNVLSLCDAIITLSERWKVLLQDTIGLKNVLCVNNVIHRTQISERKFSLGKLRILYLGIIGDRKGVFDLMDVISADKEYYSQKIELLIGGNGETDRLQKMICDNGLEEMIHFLGWVSGEKKNDCLRNADIYILPSYNEGLPISVLEAMSYGLPVITTPVGGIPEVIKDHVNGLLFTPGNKEELDHALREMLEKESMRKQMSEETGKLIQAYYPENVAEQLLSVYDFVLQGHHAIRR